ncbi:MAG: hypothetical protein K8F25_09440 [Fimbriimonadaceae bacterium]|nr:hypothetical protein [Alphaproteobacteria bacterium]
MAKKVPNKSGKRQSDIVARGDSSPVDAKSSRSDIATFVNKARQMGPLRGAGHRGRLIFAMDATMSRQPTWDMACHLQGEMFEETARIGGLDVQLVYFRGFGECRASNWVADAARLADIMSGIDCRGGHTQIGKVLSHALRETNRKKVDALVFVGDCMEENIDHLCAKAGELGLKGVPVFVFQEGGEPVAGRGFREIARLTRGAYCRFDAGASDQLRELLSAVAVYAAGGHKALQDFGQTRNRARLLLGQMK